MSNYELWQLSKFGNIVPEYQPINEPDTAQESLRWMELKAELQLLNTEFYE